MTCAGALAVIFQPAFLHFVKAVVYLPLFCVFYVIALCSHWLVQLAMLFEQRTIDSGVYVHNAVVKGVGDVFAFAFAACGILEICKGVDVTLAQ